MIKIFKIMPSTIDMEHIICQSIHENDSNTIYQLHSNGLDINFELSSGETILTYAAVHYSFDVMDAIIRCGADINLMDRNGNTTLTYIAEQHRNYADVIRYLFHEGGNIHKTNSENMSPFELAAQNGNTASLQQLLLLDNIIDTKNENGVTLLMISCYYENIECIKIVLQHGANINLPSDHILETALMKTVRYTNTCKTQTIIKILLENGADVNIKDIFDESAFFSIVQFNLTATIELFLSYNADINTQNCYNVNPFLLAIANGNISFCEQLIELKCSLSVKKNNRDWFTQSTVFTRIQLRLQDNTNQENWKHINKLFFGSGEKYPATLTLTKPHDIAKEAMKNNYDYLLEHTRHFLRNYLLTISTENLISQIQYLPLPTLIKKYLYFT